MNFIEKHEVKRKAIAHYNRMIKYAKTRPATKRINRNSMYKAIGECWYDMDCSYCKAYKFCNICPLYIGGCCGGLWCEMANAKNWREWIDRAIKVRQFIKNNG